MLWFRHNNNMRHRPEFKYIERHLGVHGLVAAYRLLEVMCDLCGSGQKFDPTLALCAKYSEQWLANEILLPTDEDLGRDNDDPYENTNTFDGNLPVDRLNAYLKQFEFAGLIELGTRRQSGWKFEDGKKTTGEFDFPTITLLDCEGMLDAWTSRYKGKGVGAGRGTRTDLG